MAESLKKNCTYSSEAYTPSIELKDWIWSDEDWGLDKTAVEFYKGSLRCQEGCKQSSKAAGFADEPLIKVCKPMQDTLQLLTQAIRTQR